MTIKEIAQLCGVSRGTVDRVLNGRGKVKPETQQLILDTMRRQGYTKNIAGRALSVKRLAPVIGAILCGRNNPFFDDVEKGFDKAEQELLPYDVRLERRSMEGHDVEGQLRLMDELEGQINALVIQPINDPRIEERIRHLKENDIPTVTVNTDIEHSCRCCYVGSDYESGGATAAGLMELVMQGRGRIGMITGVPTLMGHVLRQRGFEKRLSKCPGFAITARESAMDMPRRAYQVTTDMLQAHPEIDALFVVAAGDEQVCRAVIDLGLEHKIRIVGYDDVPATRAMVQRGIIKAVVCQQPAEQGYRSVKAAFDMILSGEMMENRRIIMENQIKIAENL